MAKTNKPPDSPRALAQWLIEQATATKDVPADPKAKEQVAALLKLFDNYMRLHRKMFDANDALRDAMLELLRDEEDAEGPPAAD
jgi:hypothetical protein